MDVSPVLTPGIIAMVQKVIEKLNGVQHDVQQCTSIDSTLIILISI